MDCMSTFEIYNDMTGGCRWGMRLGGDLTADGGEGYVSKNGARDAVDSLRKNAPDAETKYK